MDRLFTYLVCPLYSSLIFVLLPWDFTAKGALWAIVKYSQQRKRSKLYYCYVWRPECTSNIHMQNDWCGCTSRSFWHAVVLFRLTVMMWFKTTRYLCSIYYLYGNVVNFLRALPAVEIHKLYYGSDTVTQKLHNDRKYHINNLERRIFFHYSITASQLKAIGLCIRATRFSNENKTLENT